MDQPLARSAWETVGNLSLQVQLGNGPFNALSIPLRSLETTAYLALGVYGWWTTKRTTESLLAIIKVQHADTELLSASSFDVSTYKAIENSHPFYGATIRDEENGPRGLQGGELQGPLFRMADGPRGVLCIQDLTSALLCLFSHDDVFDSLFNTLNKCLIRFHQKEMQFDRQGPFSSALKDWIREERTKESFRHKSSYLMRQLDNAICAFSTVSVRDLQNSQLFDLELVNAFLLWLCVDETKHDPAIRRDYPTRSLQVWSVAFILGRLGFLVEASTTSIKDQDMWRSQVSDTANIHHLWRVHLVTSNSVFADDLSTSPPTRRKRYRERRTVPIGTIPIVAFDCFRYYNSPDLDLNLLNEVFLDAFSEVAEQLPKYPYLQALAGLGGESNEDKSVRVKVAVHSQLTKYQEQKLEDWVANPEISQLLKKSILKHIPEECPDHCGKAKCHYPVPFNDSNGNSEEALSWSQELRRHHKLMSPWTKMHVIMLAFAYAIACQFIITEDGKRAGLDTEVSWTPIRFLDEEDWEAVRIVVPDGDLKIWVRTMSDALNFHLEPLDHISSEKWPQHRRLKKTLFHMFCGLQSESVEPDLQDTIREDTLGCCANGLSLISKALINPAVDASTLHLYYICFGRILQLPVNSTHLIAACSPVKRPKYVSRYDASSQCRVSSTILQEDDVLSRDVRWDAEPDWSIDFTKVGLCCRLDGLPCGFYSPWMLARKSCLNEMDPERCPCMCSSVLIGQEIVFPDGEDWRELSLRDFYRAGALISQTHSLSDQMNRGDTRNYFVRAGKQAHNQLAALDMTLSRASSKEDLVTRKILTPCLSCAAEFARKRPSHWTGLFRGQMNSKKFINFIVLSI